MFSKSCEYAIKATIFIATHCCNESKVGIKEIAKEIDSPIAFTAKILQTLVKEGVIHSTKGVGGGFEILEKNLHKTTLLQIVVALDGDTVFMKCGFGLSNCSEEHPCPVHEKFKLIRHDLYNMLEKTTLYEVATGVKKGNYYLKY